MAKDNHFNPLLKPTCNTERLGQHLQCNESLSEGTHVPNISGAFFLRADGTEEVVDIVGFVERKPCEWGFSC